MVRLFKYLLLLFAVLFTNGVCAYTIKMPGELYIFHRAEVAEDTAIFTEGAIKNTNYTNLNVNLTSIVNSQVSTSLFNVGSSVNFPGLYIGASTALSSIATYYISHSTQSSQLQLATSYFDILYSYEAQKQGLQGWIAYKNLQLSSGVEKEENYQDAFYSEVKYRSNSEYFFSYRGKYQGVSSEHSYIISRITTQEYMPDSIFTYETLSGLAKLELKKHTKLSTLMGLMDVRLSAISTYTNDLSTYYGMKIKNNRRKGVATYSQLSWSSAFSFHQGIEIELDYL